MCLGHSIWQWITVIQRSVDSAACDGVRNVTRERAPNVEQCPYVKITRVNDAVKCFSNDRVRSNVTPSAFNFLYNSLLHQQQKYGRCVFCNLCVVPKRQSSDLLVLSNSSLHLCQCWRLDVHCSRIWRQEFIGTEIFAKLIKCQKFLP